MYVITHILLNSKGKPSTITIVFMGLNISINLLERRGERFMVSKLKSYKKYCFISFFKSYLYVYEN